VEVFDIDGVGDGHDRALFAVERFIHRKDGRSRPPRAIREKGGLRRELVDHFEDLAAPRHATLPQPVEIGDQRLGRLRGLGRLGGLDRVEFVKGDMEPWVAMAPAAPCPAGADRSPGDR